jgi:glycosyltransferase involved in cell wall biosynthesis
MSIKTIAWVTSTLHTAGGGSRLLLEGVDFYRSLGIDVQIITWDFDKEALFDNKYSTKGIHVISKKKPHKIGSIRKRSWERFRSFLILRKKIKEIDPDMILNQGEYDCTFLFIALFGTKYKYSSFIFGQMFQFHKDIAKYTLMFKKHLEQIRKSTAGYLELVPAKRPKTNVMDTVIAEVISFFRYFAIRRSVAIFVFSKQVGWEVSKLYGMPSIVLKGAYPLSLLKSKFKKHDIPSIEGEKIVLSLCRLIKKKRVDLKIRAFDFFLKHLNERNLNVKLIIGGKGEELDFLKNIVKELNIENKVTFIGYVQESLVYPYVSSCDSYISLDVADFDISPYEALGLKKPVIWSNEMDLDMFLNDCPAVIPVYPDIENVANAIKISLEIKTDSIQWDGLEKYSWEYYFQEILNSIETRL